MTQGELDGNRDNESDEDSDLDSKLQAAEQAKKELEQVGWVWRDENDTKFLCNPSDPDIRIWFHPYSGEQLLSPKLVERLKQDADRERQTDAPVD
ncbi:MAG TPA: hypothetical protein VGN12_15670 [Pirellulales bacterium]|jgi:hypothetical protein